MYDGLVRVNGLVAQTCSGSMVGFRSRGSPCLGRGGIATSVCISSRTHFRSPQKMRVQGSMNGMVSCCFTHAPTRTGGRARTHGQPPQPAHAHSDELRFSAAPIWVAAAKAPRTAAEPPMSRFIDGIPVLVLMLSPPAFGGVNDAIMDTTDA